MLAIKIFSRNIIYSNKIAIIILCLLGVVIYSNTFQSSFHFDDNSSIIENSNITNLADLKAIWNFWPTRFLTYLSIAVNYHFGQLNVVGYHLFNLVVHLVSAIMVWWLVFLTLSTPEMKDNKITRFTHHIAFFVALIFIAHPIQTQAVTYIIQRAASLATLFYLLAVSLYVKSKLVEGETNKRLYYAGSLITTIIAMFTKETTLTLPLMILLYQAWFFRTKKGINYRRLLPLLVTILVIPLTMIITNTVNIQEMRLSAEGGAGYFAGALSFDSV
ncbi:MAG: hypothetical protein ABH952_11540 [Candidatus Omnitrophota bacterium]